MELITEAVRKAAETSVLCWLATVDTDGRPQFFTQKGRSAFWIRGT